MSKFVRIGLAVLVLGAVLGVGALGLVDIQPRTERVELILPDARFPQ